MSQANKFISMITGLLVAFLALAAFVLSFDALRHLAAGNGIAGGMAWLYPAIIDGAIIIFSLSVLQASLNQDKTLYPWALVAVFTVLSVALNIVHAPQDFLPRILAAIPPVALFLSFELLMSQVKGIVHRAAAFQSLRELAATARQKRSELDTVVQERTADRDKLAAQIERLEQKKTELMDELTVMRQEKRAFGSRLEQINVTRSAAKQEALDALLSYLTERPNATLSEMAEAIQRSKTTASGYVAELRETGRLHKNGHGWEVREQ